MAVLSGLEPGAVFHYFEEICGIPHGSGNTGEISRYCVEWAKERGFKVRQDKRGNVVIWKPGTPGFEESEPVMIQGHLDMVCEREEDCEFDFEKQGLELMVKDKIISANSTTLGGDDGIAVAYALALLESKESPHPPLEVVLTVDEEIGMLGADYLDCSDLQSKRMLNLDSEEEGYLLVSCAGGVSVTAGIPIHTVPKKGYTAVLTISGLQGGHSGVEIDKGRGNACQLLGRTLYKLKQEITFGIIRADGGLKDNAIPREAKAELLLASAEDLTLLQREIERLEHIFRHEFRNTDGAVRILCESYDLDIKKEDLTLKERDVWDSDSEKRVITALYCFPGGVQAMSPDIENLVRSSLNLGIMATEEKQIVFTFSVRSSVESEKEELVERLRCLIEFVGGTISLTGDYPAWEYKNDSPLRDIMVEKYEELYGEKPVVQAIHAGVECGLFAGKIPGLDCVSFGPDMKDIHTPKESMDADSVKRTWDYLLAVLRALK